MKPKTAPSRRILIVEDVQETRDAIERLLEYDAYTVDAVRDEADAILRARWHRPDLILISLGGTADELTATARNIRAGAGLPPQVPVVIFSVSTLPEGAERDLGENIYAVRPENFNQLRALVTRALQAAAENA